METEEKETMDENFENNLSTYMDGSSILTGDYITTTGSTIGSSSGYYLREEWSEPHLVDVDEGENYLALTYTQSKVSCFYTGYSATHSDVGSRRVYKIIYSCRGGKWHKSDKIYGRIVPPTEETYTDFEVDLDVII
jgi:hypothetical protein